MTGRPSFLLAMRMFAKTREEVPAVKALAAETIKRAVGLQLPGEAQPFFEGVLLLVWGNPIEYPGMGDTGEGYAALRELEQDETVRVRVLPVKAGDLFVHVPNQGVKLANQLGVDFIWFLSPEAADCLTPAMGEKFVEAAQEGALQIGVALPELGHRAFEGFTANTCAAWHVESLLEVGSFDSISAQVRSGENSDKAAPLAYWDETQHRVEYATCHGVEEVVPLARLFLQHGARQVYCTRRLEPNTRRSTWIRNVCGRMRLSSLAKRLDRSGCYCNGACILHSFRQQSCRNIGCNFMAR